MRTLQAIEVISLVPWEESECIATVPGTKSDDSLDCQNRTEESPEPVARVSDEGDHAQE